MKYIYLLIMGLTIVSCKHSIINDTSILKVDLEPTEVSIHDLFDSIRIIPLETTDNSLLTGPVELLTTAQANYVLDWNNFKLFVKCLNNT